MDFIFIEGLQVEASVGIYEHERLTRQMLDIELRIELPTAAAAHDDIVDTIDYDKVVRCIREAVLERHFNLLETTAEFLIELLFERFRAPWVRISIAKLGVVRGVRRVGVTIERHLSAAK